MKKPLFTGVCTALVTPFLNQEVNYPLLEQLIRRQMDAGIHTLLLSGTTGESPTLSDNEKITMIKVAKEYTGNTCTIIAGTGTNSTEHAIQQSIAAQKAGADAVLVVSPYYNKGNTDGLYRHFAAIAKSIDIPIILYNVPSRTGVDIPISVYKKLSNIENIIGVKEAVNDITKIAKLRSLCPHDFYVWSGNDDQIVPVMSLGGKGVISVLSNLCPEETSNMVEFTLNDDYHSAANLQIRLMPLIEILFSEVNPLPIKYAMRYAGFDCGECRLPLGSLSESCKKLIDNYFYN